MRATTTVTSGYTYVTGVNYETTYSTSLVTAFALSSTPASAPAKKRQAYGFPNSSLEASTASVTSSAGNVNASPLPAYASPACANDAAYSSACACAFSVTPTTRTNKIFTATATATSTYTYSEVAQATQTLAACDPANNYGYFAGTIVWDSDFDGGETGFPVGEPRQVVLPNSSPEACCLSCYELDGEGCVEYSYLPGNASCALTVSDGGCPVTPEGRLQVILYPNDQKPLVGVGNCDVEVQGFNG
ncbi:MAG: hypothetical protein M1822_006896 [Bathelium mastoideum]|nr:MAG: hypothetical protein M1822_006896 [Bathelium mastoideum]